MQLNIHCQIVIIISITYLAFEDIFYHLLFYVHKYNCITECCLVVFQ